VVRRQLGPGYQTTRPTNYETSFDDSDKLASCQSGLLLQANPPNKKARPNFIGLTVQSDQNNFPKNLPSVESGRSLPQIFWILKN
jgi:hypothetical protein